MSIRRQEALRYTSLSQVPLARGHEEERKVTFTVGKRHTPIVKFLTAKAYVLDPRWPLLVLGLVQGSAGAVTGGLTARRASC